MILALRRLQPLQELRVLLRLQGLLQLSGKVRSAPLGATLGLERTTAALQREDLLLQLAHVLFVPQPSLPRRLGLAG